MLLAEQVLELDQATLKKLLPEIQARMEQADGTPEWERAVVAFFMINAVRAKDHLAKAHGRPDMEEIHEPPRLRVVK